MTARCRIILRLNLYATGQFLRLDRREVVLPEEPLDFVPPLWLLPPADFTLLPLFLLLLRALVTALLLPDELGASA